MSDKRRRPRAKGTGSVYQMKGSRFYWVAYTADGKRHFENTKSERKADAQKLLTDRLGDIGKGLIVTPKVGKVTIKQGCANVVTDMSVNGRQFDGTQRRIDKHIIRRFATADTPETGYFHPDRRMNTVSTADLSAYVAHRMEQNAAAASCNLELAIIRRAFRLAVRGGELMSMPHIPMLTLHNTRTGFFEPHEFAAVLGHLPEYLHAPLKFAFITGWRLRSEVLSLTAAQVDLQAGVVRLEPGSTKNKEGRSFHLTAELRAVLQDQLASLDVLKKRGTICPWVFHRSDGSPIKSFRGVWTKACDAAGYPGKLFHDFRRSAVRTLERAGVPRSTAMQMVGHKTEAIYRRYAIVDAAMLREGAAKLDAYAAEQKTAAAKERKGQLRRFKQA